MDKERYVLINGEKIIVSEEVYRVYYRPIWREAKRKSIRSEMECSLDALSDTGFEAISNQKTIFDIIFDKLLADKLYELLAELADEDRNMLCALYFQGKSEREVGRLLGISSVAVHKRKHKILKRMHYLLQNW